MRRRTDVNFRGNGLSEDPTDTNISAASTTVGVHWGENATMPSPAWPKAPNSGSITPRNVLDISSQEMLIGSFTVVWVLLALSGQLHVPTNTPAIVGFDNVTGRNIRVLMNLLGPFFTILYLDVLSFLRDKRRGYLHPPVRLHRSAIHSPPGVNIPHASYDKRHHYVSFGPSVIQDEACPRV